MRWRKSSSAVAAAFGSKFLGNSKALVVLGVSPAPKNISHSD